MSFHGPTVQKALEEIPVVELKAMIADCDLAVAGFAKMNAAKKRDAVFALMEQDPANFGLMLPKLVESSSYTQDQLTGVDATDERSISPPETGPDVEAAEDGQPPVEADAHAPAIVAEPTAKFVNGKLDTIASDVAGLGASDALASLHNLTDEVERFHFAIGAVLSHVAAKGLYTEAGYKNMRDYIEAETTLGYRKAMYLRQNYEGVRELGLSEEQLKGVGWSVLRFLLPIMTKDNAKLWLDRARECKQVDLIREVQIAAQKALPDESGKGKAKAKADKSDDDTPANAPKKVVSRTYQFFDDQAETVDAAISKAMQETGTEQSTVALDVIAAHYCQSPVAKSSLLDPSAYTSLEAMKVIFETLRQSDEKSAKSANDKAGFMRVMEAVEAVWPDVTINVDFDADS